MRRRVRPLSTAGVVAVLVDGWEERAARFAGLASRSPYADRVARLLAGGSVEVSGWELPDVYRPVGCHPFDRFVVFGDGRVELVRRRER